jgi:hypothetical protein
MVSKTDARIEGAGEDHGAATVYKIRSSAEYKHWKIQK